MLRYELGSGLEGLKRPENIKINAFLMVLPNDAKMGMLNYDSGRVSKPLNVSLEIVLHL